MTARLVFVIPVRHPDSVADWGIVRRDLARTIASVARQTGTGWECRVVANRGADLPALPPGFSLREVDLPRPDLPDRITAQEAFFDGVRHDKGLRLLAGMRDVAPDSYVMPVDFDDFISRRLAAFVTENQGAPGWFVREGHVYDGGRWTFLSRRFHERCGTCLIVRRDLLGRLETADGAPELETVKRNLGSHIFLKPDLAAAGTPLAPLPFPGALYRIGNPQSTSGTSGLFRTMTPWSQIRHHPRTMLPTLLRYRPVGAALRQEFGPI